LPIKVPRDFSRVILFRATALARDAARRVRFSISEFLPRDTACAAIFRVEVYGLRGFASSLPRAHIPRRSRRRGGGGGSKKRGNGREMKSERRRARIDGDDIAETLDEP